MDNNSIYLYLGDLTMDDETCDQNLFLTQILPSAGMQNGLYSENFVY